MAFSSSCFNRVTYYCCSLVLLVVVWVSSRSCEAFGTFGFDIHHRYSDPVKGILDLDGLPEKGSLQYYSAMADRDRLIRGRHLAQAAADQQLLSFYGGNQTFRLNTLGFLHYANVSVGTPSLSFLVALDTGSDLFWLPCDCKSCVHGLRSKSGREIDFNIYSPNISSTAMKVPCNSTMCGQRRHCSLTRNACPYEVAYLSNNTSSSGILVEDILRLTTDDSPLKAVDAQITMGCGIMQTGSFLDGVAPNGLFGLGMDNISVPSMLASKGLAANSFSMCFGGPDGIGRIVFGDEGSSNQRETPFNLRESHQTYNISMTQISVGDNVSDTSFSAIFDSGTSFTHLNDPAYTIISGSFTSQAQEKRYLSDSEFPFEYCYELSANQTTFEIPNVTLTMKGGDQYSVIDPIILISLSDAARIYCLAVFKSGDLNIIGQNFMSGYRIVFDREKMVLGWKASDCYATDSNTLPTNPRNNPTVAPPTSAVTPEATSRNGSGSPLPRPSLPMPAGSDSTRLSAFTLTFLVILFLPIIANI